ncbi:MAG: SLC13 family permease [Peptococcaceae bacterium]
MSEKVAGKNTAWYINSALVILITIGVGFLPPFGQVTPMGMKVLGVFLGVLYGWCTVSMLWPSVWGIVALGCTGFCTVEESFGMAFGNDIVLLVILSYMLAKYLEDSGLSSYIANWFISRKIGEGRPWVFTILIFAAAYVLGALLSSILCTVIIMWGIFYSVCEKVGIAKKSWYSAIVLFGIVLTCTAVGILFSFKPMAALVIGLVQKGVGAVVEVNFFKWFLFQLIWSLVLVAAYILVARFVFHPDVSALKEAGKTFAHLRNQKMDGNQKVAAVVLTIFLLIMFLPGILPATVPGMALLKNINVLGGISLCLIGLSILKKDDGVPIANVTKLLSEGVNWTLILLLAATMPLGDALESADVGIIATIVAWLTGIFGGLDSWLIGIAVVVLFGIATQFAHNLILIVVFTPVLAGMAASFGMSPLVMGLLMAATCASAFLTPAASANAAIVFGNTEWVATKQAYILGGIIAVLYWIITIVVGIPLGNFLFG